MKPPSTATDGPESGCVFDRPGRLAESVAEAVAVELESAV